MIGPWQLLFPKILDYVHLGEPPTKVCVTPAVAWIHCGVFFINWLSIGGGGLPQEGLLLCPHHSDKSPQGQVAGPWPSGVPVGTRENKSGSTHLTIDEPQGLGLTILPKHLRPHELPLELHAWGHLYTETTGTVEVLRGQSKPVGYRA